MKTHAPVAAAWTRSTRSARAVVAAVSINEADPAVNESTKALASDPGPQMQERGLHFTLQGEGSALTGGRDVYSIVSDDVPLRC